MVFFFSKPGNPAWKVCKTKEEERKESKSSMNTRPSKEQQHFALLPFLSFFSSSSSSSRTYILYVQLHRIASWSPSPIFKEKHNVSHWSQYSFNAVRMVANFNYSRPKKLSPDISTTSDISTTRKHSPSFFSHHKKVMQKICNERKKEGGGGEGTWELVREREREMEWGAACKFFRRQLYVQFGRRAVISCHSVRSLNCRERERERFSHHSVSRKKKKIEEGKERSALFPVTCAQSVFHLCFVFGYLCTPS